MCGYQSSPIESGFLHEALIGIMEVGSEGQLYYKGSLSGMDLPIFIWVRHGLECAALAST